MGYCKNWYSDLFPENGKCRVKTLFAAFTLFFSTVIYSTPAFAIEQYAHIVAGYSSQYNSWPYYAIESLGAPNATWQSSYQWFPASTNGTSESITLEFATPVYADGVTIREAYGNGFVTQIDVLDLNDALTTVWAGTDTTPTGSVQDFTVSWTQTTYLVKGVKIYVNTSKTTGWEGIDSVKLTGSTPLETNPPTGAIIVNVDSPTYTTSTTVTLTLICADLETTDCSQMRFSADNATWSVPEAYFATKPWTFSSGDGVKTVYVKFRDAAGNWSATYSDTITLDTTNPTGTITINNYAGYATSTSATMNLSASDTNGISMQFSNDGTNWTSLEAFSATKAYTLPSGDGTKTVYVRYVDNAGNSIILNDTITLNTTSFFQYSSLLGGYSSQGSWWGVLAIEALGAPNSWWQGYYNWTPSSQNGTSEYITLEYATPVYADGVAIRENYGNGFVTQIDLIDLDDALTTVWTGTDTTPTGSVGEFVVGWTQTTSLVNGVKIYIDTNKTTSWEGIDSVQLKGIPPPDITAPTGSISINSAAEYTTSTAVTLNVTCADDSGSCSHMRFSTDNVIWGSQETYFATKSWTFASGDGVKTIYVKFRDATGNWSATYSDSITLDTTNPTGTITINNYSAYTASVSATLNLSASDTNGIRMQFSNDETNWTALENYSGTKAYTLPSGEGTKRVYVRYVDNAGNSITLNDTITLDTTSLFQYANVLADYSSQGSWWGVLAIESLGAPNSWWQGYYMWTPSLQNGTSEYITLEYATPVYADGVAIREAYGNGFVTQIDVIELDGVLTTVWTGIDTTPTGSVGEFVVGWTQTTTLVKGVKIYVDTSKTTSWEGIDSVQLKGTPPSDTTAPTGLISINSAAPYTTSASVTLNVTCSDDSGSCSQMRFSTDNVTWSSQETYFATKSWTFSSGDGVKTIYVKFRDATGNWSATYSDTIIFDTTNPTGSITINNYAAYAASASTTLNLSASDTNGIKMQFSDDGTTWSVLENYATTKAYTLQSGDGIKSVYVKFVDNAGNFITLNDTITLNTTSFFQYASVLADYSSQGNWWGVLATGALGAPNSWWQGYHVWSPSSQNGTSEYITLEYSTPVYADGVAIRETDGNGFVTQVDVIDLDDTLTTVWTGTDITPTGSVEEFVVEWPQTTTLVKGVKIYVDTSKTTSWEGIDSVQLKGTPPSDITAPTGSISINSAVAYSSSPSVTLNITCTDNSGSCSHMRFSNDNSTWSSQEIYSETKAWTLAGGDGTKTVYVKFRDTTGNWSATYSDSIIFDSTNPTGSITINNYGAYATSATTTLNLSASDTNGIKMQFSNDGTNWSVLENYATTKAYTLPSGDGTKRVYVRYVDNAGNSIMLSDTITMDTTSVFQYASSLTGYSSQGTWWGVLAIESLGAPNSWWQGYYMWTPSSQNGTSEYISFEFATPVYADGVAIREVYGNGFVYKVDAIDLTSTPHTVWTGIDQTPTGAPIDFNVSWPRTTYTVKGVKIYVDTNRSTSWEGIDSVQLRGGMSYENNPPSGTISINSGSVYSTTSEVSVRFTCSDVESYCAEMSLSDDGLIWITEPYVQVVARSLPGGDGVRTVYVKFKDSAGNWSSVISDSITLDTTAPITVASPLAGTYISAQSVGLSASEPSTIRYTTNGTEPTSSSPIYSGFISVRGTTTIKYFATDVAGNQEAVQTSLYTINDLTAPTGTIVINSNSPYTTSTAVSLALTCSEGEGVCEEMQFSEDNIIWTTAEPYSTSRSWTLSTGYGLKTVYVKFKDSAGNWSNTYSDAIMLDAAPELVSISFDDADGSSSVTIGDAYLFKFTERMEQVALSNNTQEANLNLSPEGKRYGTNNIIRWSADFTEVTVEITAGFNIIGNELVDPSNLLTDSAGNPVSNALNLNLTDVIKPDVARVRSNYISPVSATNNYRLTIQFNSSMKTTVEPLVTINSTGTSSPVVPSGGTWMTTLYPNDTYFTPAINLSQGMDGTLHVNISSGQDWAGNLMLPETNIFEAELNATPPPNPTVLITDRKCSSATLSWSGYTPPSDLTGFQIYRDTTGSFSSVEGKTFTDLLAKEARSFVVTPLNLDTPYYFAVVAMDSLGNIFKTVDSQTILINQLVPPQVAAVVNAGLEPDSAVISWDGYDTTNLCGLKEFRVYLENSDFTSVTALTPYATVNSSAKDFHINGLDRTKTYFMAVVGVNQANEFVANVTTSRWADPLAGDISSNITIGAGDQKEISVKQSMTVKNNAVITILPGTTIYFAPGTGIVIEQGKLLAEGARLKPIILTSENDHVGFTPALGDWAGVTIGGSNTGSILKNVFIKYGLGLNLVGNTATLEEFTALYNGQAGLKASNSALLNTSDALLSYNEAGVIVETGGQITITNSVIKNNTVNASSDGSTLNATGNWWGALNLIDINNKIVGAVNSADFLLYEPVLSPAVGVLDEKSLVSTRNITLLLASRNAEEMRISEDSFFTNLFFKEFAVTDSFTLSPNGGDKTIFAEFKSGTGNISTPVSVDVRYLTEGAVIETFSLVDGERIGRPKFITAQISAILGLSAVELYVDNILIHSDTLPLFSYKLDVRNFTNGIHRVKLIARDNGGNATTIEKNIVIELLPPAAPNITSPIDGVTLTSGPIIIRGTAEPFIQITLRRNGFVVGSQVTNGNGLFEISNITIQEGLSEFIATASDSIGNSPNSNIVNVTLDTGAPADPVMKSATPMEGRKISILWGNPLVGEKPTKFNLYRHTSDFTDKNQATLISAGITSLSYINEQISDGTYYYGVIGFDGANNSSNLSNILSTTYDGTKPTFEVSFGGIPPVGVGVLNINLKVSEILAEKPSLTIKPFGTGVPLAVALTKIDDFNYGGTFEVKADTASGIAAINVSGRDLAGNLYTGAPTVGVLTIDTTGPTALITTTPLEPVQVLADTNVAINVTFNEPVKSDSIPMLTFNPPVGAPVNVVLSGSGTSWTGTLTLTSGMGSGLVQFVLSALDALGNSGSTITSGSSLEIYNTATPSATVAPSNLKVTPLAGGKVKVTWSGVEKAESYRVYRKVGACDVNPVDVIADNLALLEYTDTPTDGIYCYAVSALRLGAESALSLPASATSDSLAPNAPENVLVSMSDVGVKISWQKPLTGETPAKYLVYRDGVKIKTIATSSASVEVRDYPGVGATYSYVVASSDEVGNESSASPVEFVLKLGAISNLQVLINNDDVPLLTWQKVDPNTVGYNVYRNGSKINGTLLTEPSFSDSYFSGNLDFKYEVRGVNALGEESPGRTVDIFPIALEVKANPDQDGNPQPLVINYLSKFEIKVTNTDLVDSFQLETLHTRMTVNGVEQHKSDKEVNSTIVSGTSYAETIIIPIDASLEDHILKITAIQPGDAGSQVIYQRHFLFSEVVSPSVAIEMTVKQLPMAGGYSTVNLCVNNSGYMDMDVIVNRVNGSKPGDIFVAIKNSDGMEISRAEYQGYPSGTRISSGIGYVTIARAGNLCVDMSILVPASLEEGAVLTFVGGVKGYSYALTGINVVSASGLTGTMQSGITFSDYYGTAQADKETYVNNELIVITGQAIDRASSTPKPGAALKIGFYTRGFKWYQDVTADESGNFRYEYRPGLGISGKFIIWAAHPDVYDRIDQDRFSLYRMYAVPEQGAIRTSKADTLRFKIDLLNPGEVALSGFSSQFRAYTVDGSGNKIDVTTLQGTVNFPAGFQMGAGERKNIELQLSADIDAPNSVNVEYTMNTAEGASVVFNGSVTLLQAVPLISMVSPATGYIDASLDTGAMATVPVTIKNNGLETLLNAELKLPQNILWISSNLQQVSAGKILLGDINVGESKSFDIIFSPPADIAFGDYNDKITISGSNSPQLFDINVYALITSNLKGSALFNVYNNLGQKVEGAIVGIHNNVIHQQIGSLKTDVNGALTIADLNTGNWSYQVTAPGHNTVSGVVSVVAGQTVLVEPELVKNLVSVTFSVVPVPFTDRYEMKIEQKFDTHVPVPVLIVDPPYVQLSHVTPGTETTIMVTISNFGLKALDNVILETADTGTARLEPLITFFPRLGAMETVEVPYRVLYRGKGNVLPGNAVGDCAGGLIPSIDFDGLTSAVEGIGAIVRGSTNSYISQQEREAMGRLAVGILVAAHAANFAQSAAGVGRPAEFLASSAAQFAGCLLGSVISGAPGTSTTPPPPYPSQPNYFTGNGGQGCFAEGTPVLMADGGIQKIEVIKVGDAIMTYDGKAGSVSKIYVRESDHILELRYRELTKDGEEVIKRLETTDEHEFWIINKNRWVPANQLEAGDMLITLNGNEVTVIGKQHLDIPTVVYNFDVDGYESYFINGVLAHQKYGIGQENEADQNLRKFLNGRREFLQSLQE